MYLVNWLQRLRFVAGPLLRSLLARRRPRCWARSAEFQTRVEPERLEDRTLLAAGLLDPAFGGGDGIATASVGSFNFIDGMTQDAAGNVLVTGASISGGNFQSTLARYSPDGSLDTTFGGGDGHVITALGTSSSSADDVLIDGNGNILVAGEGEDAGSQEHFALARFTSAGVLDTSFGGGDGIATTVIGPSSDLAKAVVQDGAGRYVVAGESHNGHRYDVVLARYSADGILDAGFGGTIAASAVQVSGT